MPMNLSFLLMAPESSAIDRDEVFVAKIVSGLQMLSSVLYKSVLILTSSMIASITRSESATRLRSVVNVTRAAAASLAACSSFPFSTWRARALLSFAFALPIIPSVISRTITSKPLRAKTCAISHPMVPAPIMLIFFIKDPHFIQAHTLLIKSLRIAPFPGRYPAVYLFLNAVTLVLFTNAVMASF